MNETKDKRKKKLISKPVVVPTIDQSRFHGVKSEDVLMKFVRAVDLARRERNLYFPTAAYLKKLKTINLMSLAITFKLGNI